MTAFLGSDASAPTQASNFAPTVDLGLCANMEFAHGYKAVRLERIEANGDVDLRDLRTNSLLSVRNKDGSTARPSVNWMRDEYASGRLAARVPLPEKASERQARFLLLDVNAAEARDGKVRWRHSLAWRALADEVLQTDHACLAWLNVNYGLMAGDFVHPCPSPAALRRWMRSLKKGYLRVSSLVSTTGRLRNVSQLEPQVDDAVTAAALHFYALGPGATQAMAESHLYTLIEKLNAKLPATRDTPYKLPTRQTLRKRIFKLECFDTWSTKFGKEAAKKKFFGHGEPLIVDHFLELGVMDATELEQIIVFDENWAIPVLKLKITAIACAASGALVGWSVYAGPNRAETSAQAYLHCLQPDKFPPRMVQMFPELKLVFGRFAAVTPDNEKALIGPETVSGYNECGTTIIPAPVATPQAKATLERLWRTVKEKLATMPGTLVDPKRASEIGFDAVQASAQMTIHQVRDMVAQVAAEINTSGKGLIGMSPIEFIKVRSRATPAFEDISQFRAALARTFRVFVTRNGVEKDGIRYRCAATLDVLFDNNRGRLGEGSKNGFAMRGRRNDGDLDSIEVYDEHSREWATLPSTQPSYTAGLSLFEHQQYTAAAKTRREAFGSADARLRSSAETLRVYEELLPKAKFKRKAAMAALALSKQVSDLAGKQIVLPEESDHALQSVITDRIDDPTVSDVFAASAAPARLPRPEDHRLRTTEPEPDDAWSDDIDDEEDE